MTASAVTMAAIPVPKPSDDDEVTWALSTAAALWGRGSTVDALKWLRRAAESANDLRDDGRALELYKVAAELASAIPPAEPSRPPPSAVRPLGRPVPSAEMHRAPTPSVRAPASSAPPRPAPTTPVSRAPLPARNPGSSLPPPSGRAAHTAPAPSAPPPPPSSPRVESVAAPSSVSSVRRVLELVPPSQRPAAQAIVEVEPELVEAVPAPVAMTVAPVAPSVAPRAPVVTAPPPLPVSSGFQARVMVIPMSRTGELRVVLIPADTDPPPGTLIAVLTPESEGAETIRSLLFGIE